MKLTEIEITNYKSVAHGVLNFERSRREHGATITAIYGPNGTGKTVVVEALNIMRLALSGKTIPVSYAEGIRSGSNTATFTYRIVIEKEDILRDAEYIEPYDGKAEDNPSLFRNYAVEYQLTLATIPEGLRAAGTMIMNEKLLCSYQSEAKKEDKADRHVVAEFDLGDGVSPRRFKQLFNGFSLPEGVCRFYMEQFSDEKLRREYFEGKGSQYRYLAGDYRNLSAFDPEKQIRYDRDFKEYLASGRSYIFQKDSEGILPLVWMMTDNEATITYYLGRLPEDVVIINAEDVAPASRESIPFFLGASIGEVTEEDLGEQGSLGSQMLRQYVGTTGFVTYHRDFIRLSLTDPCLILLERDWDNICQATDNLNAVLSRLVPGLTLKCELIADSYGIAEMMDEDGISLLKKLPPDDYYVVAQLFTVRDGVAVPLKNESLGILKLISLTGLLIDVFHVPSCVAVVDELDSNLFEFLLGDILAVLKEGGSGQLIFTAHNLRPLETMSENGSEVNNSVIFTTVDPENRYRRMQNVREKNNLRDKYLSAIGSGNEQDGGGRDAAFYNGVPREELAKAFRRLDMSKYKRVLPNDYDWNGHPTLG